MRFTWDEAKRQFNLAKHGYDFADVEFVFERRTVTFEDDRFDYGEVRYITIGVLNGRIVSIVHRDDFDVIRVISMRKASRREERIYTTGIPD